MLYNEIMNFTTFINSIKTTSGVMDQPFVPFPSQINLVEFCESNQFVIGKKERQNGTSTMLLLYELWKCMYKRERKILFVTGYDREAKVLHDMASRTIMHMPVGIRPLHNSINDYRISFADSESHISFYSVSSGSFRGSRCTDLIIEEAAFIPNMEEHWKSVYPLIWNSGNLIMISTPNPGSWFDTVYQSAVDGLNIFKTFSFSNKIIDLI